MKLKTVTGCGEFIVMVCYHQKTLKGKALSMAIEQVHGLVGEEVCMCVCVCVCAVTLTHSYSGLWLFTALVLSLLC